MTTFILLIIFVLWSAVVLKNALFWIYFGQIKEYRFDRLKVHFELASSRNLILNKQNALLFILLLASVIPIGQIKLLIILAALLYYGFFASRAFQYVQNNTLKTPKFTFRAFLITTLVLTIYGIGTMVMFTLAFGGILVWFLAADLAIPLITLLVVFATQPFFSFLKNKSIQKAAKKRREMKNLLVIGITGSYGKSSMKEIVASILSKKFKVLKTPENVNADIGVAHVILEKLKKEHEVFIVEMGAYKKGEIEKTARMVKPQIGILTGINTQHSSIFGNLTNIQQTKYELVKALPEKGLVLFNGDDKNIHALYRQCKNPKRLYTTNPSSIDKTQQDITLNDIKVNPGGLELTLTEGEEEFKIKTSLLGRHSAINIMGAIILARELQMDWKAIKEAIEEIEPHSHTLQPKKGIKDSIVIDDTYSANESGVLAALDVLDHMKARRKICVIQPLIELGSSAERVHRSIAAKIAQTCDFCIITGKDYFPLMYQEALDNRMNKNAIFCFPNAHDALRKTQELTDKGDVILLENRIPERIIDGLIMHKNK